MASFRQGRWDAFFDDVRLAEELLGDRSDSPPGFAADHIAAAAFVCEVQGRRDRPEADLPEQVEQEHEPREHSNQEHQGAVGKHE